MTDPEKPKLIIDEDWKSQVQQEKAQQKVHADQGSGPGDAHTADDPDLPPPSFPWLITTLATQAMAAMGHLPDPLDGELVRRPRLARHHIETLVLLQEKTKGNLSPEESLMLENVLHELRMAFVAEQSRGRPV